MNEQEANDVLRHCRTQLRSAGFADVDAEAMEVAFEAASSLQERLSVYLDQVDVYFRLRSRGTARKVLAGLNQVLETQRGQPIVDIVVTDEMAGSTYTAEDMPSLEVPLRRLDRLRLDLRES